MWSAELSDLKSKNLYLEDQWLISKTKLCKIELDGVLETTCVLV